MSATYSAFKLSFVDSPIYLTGGLAGNNPGIVLPLLALTESLNLVNGVLTGDNIGLDSFFGAFRIPAGGTLIKFQYAHYPFANQSVAANAAIQQPLNISLIMSCPVRETGGYFTKIAIMNALQAMLSAHVAQGGTFIVLTPAYFYTNCLLLQVTDVTPNGEEKQAQAEFQFDFEAPLLTLPQAQQAQNSLMSKFTSGTQISGTPGWGASSTIGTPASSNNLLGSIGPTASPAPFTAAAPAPAVTSSSPPAAPGT